jgi:hypothetical protein
MRTMGLQVAFVPASVGIRIPATTYGGSYPLTLPNLICVRVPVLLR